MEYVQGVALKIAKSNKLSWELRNDVNRKPTVQFDNTIITHVDHLKYLGMALDRTFSYKPHLAQTGMKVNFRINENCKWSTGAHTLRSACIAFVYSAAEYCEPVWPKLMSNWTMLCAWSQARSNLPPLQWMPVLSYIALFRDLKNCWSHGRSLLISCKMATVLWIIGENHGCQMSR
jgi:hypothetical protein